MIIENQDTLNEGLALLEFIEDVTTAWNKEYIDVSDNTLFGLTYIVRHASDKIKEACGKTEE